MYRYGPRFGMPIDPYMAPPMADVQFRGGPQNGPLSQQGGGSMASGSMQGPQQQQGGGMGLGEAAAAAGLLSKLSGGASPLAGLTKQAVMLGDPLLGMGGMNSLDAFLGSGAGAGELGSFMGGIAGAGGAGGSPFPLMEGAGLLGTAATGPEAALASGAGAGAGSGGALSLAGPAAAAFAVPGLLNGILGSNIPDPFGELMGLFGL